MSDAPPTKARAILSTYARPLLLLGATLLTFTLARAALLLRSADDFATLTAGARGLAFLQGLRFDFSTICLFLGLPVLALLLPFPWARTRRWQQVWGWIGFGVFALFALVLACDVVYFGYVHRHAGIETAALGETLKAVTASAFTSYLLPLLILVAAIIGLGWAWKKALARELPPLVHFGGQIAVAGLALIFVYYGERGTLSGKRLRSVHAFEALPEQAAHLALNGPFSISHALWHARPAKSDFFPWPDALKTAQEALWIPGERQEDPEYPLLRWRRTPPVTEFPNVVVLMLESWDASAVGPESTPCFDALSREGLLFPRFYASGQRSMDGMSALLCGFPTLPGTSYLGRGLEQSSLTSMARLAKAEGFDTWFIQSSERDSFRCNAIAPRLGFDHYLGAEDIPPEPPAAPRGVLRGACWDHEMFAEANRKLASSKKPFLAFLYTNTTHPPYHWPEERWKKHEGNAPDQRYLNSLGYADWALGRFFESAKSAGWFQKTVFVVTSDHVGGPSGTGVDPAARHHIPCLLLGPNVKPGVDRRIGSQLDVIPTLVDLAGWKTSHAALGTSLFSDPVPGRGALCVQDSLVLRVEEEGFVVHDLQGRLSSKGDADAIERRLLSVVQVAYTLLRTNRIGR